MRLPAGTGEPEVRPVDEPPVEGDVIIRGTAFFLPLKAESVHCIVTSPPYWGLRKYSGLEGEQFGLEPTIESYIEHSMQVLDECWRVLRKDGTCWWNLGDSYCAGARASQKEQTIAGKLRGEPTQQRNQSQGFLKDKDLCLVPFRFALAAQERGWWVRSAIIWNKPNPMPESVTDRPTDAYEFIFLLTKSGKYWYDAEAVRERYDKPLDRWGGPQVKEPDGGFLVQDGDPYASMLRERDMRPNSAGRNLRNVWTFATTPFPSDLANGQRHFACFPEELPRRCLLAGCPEKTCEKCGAGWVRILDKTPSENPSGYNGSKFNDGATAEVHPNVGQGLRFETKTLGWKPACDCENEGTGKGVCLDPFLGSGTVVDVANRAGRIGIGVELSPEYINLAKKRTENSRKQGVLI